MTILKWLLAIVALLALVVFGGGQFLRADYHVERSIVINAPADKVYGLIDSSKGWASWGVWYRKDPQMQVTDSGVSQGLGASWSWKSKTQGNGSLKLTTAEPGRKIAYELQMEDFDPSGGELLLSPEGSGTKVVWVCKGTMSNVVGRWFALFMDKMLGPDFEGGLANLKQVAEKQ